MVTKNNLQNLLENIGNSRTVVKNATGGESQSIALGVQQFGKRVSPRFIRALGEEQLTTRINFQEQYKIMIGGWLYGCRSGAELLWTDLELFWRQAQKAFQISARPILNDAANLKDLILIKNRIDLMLAA